MFEQEKEDTILDASYEVGTRKGQVQKKKKEKKQKRQYQNSEEKGQHFRNCGILQLRFLHQPELDMEKDLSASG